MKILRFLVRIIGLGSIAVVLIACGQREVLSNVTTSTDVITPNGDGVDDALTINYTIGEQATISVFLEDQAGERYILRDKQMRVPSSEAYSLLFDGTVNATDPGIVQQVLPDGMYTYTIEAAPVAGGPSSTATGQISVREAADQPPEIEDLSVTEQFSPNEDADDDVAYFSYRLPVTATVTINFVDQNNASIPFITELQEGPFAHSHIWDGKRPDGSLVSSGTYTYTIVARDQVGNIVQHQGQIEVVSPGRSSAVVTFAQIAPVRIALGSALTVRVRVKNTGDVPIKTQGPPSGYEYSTDDIFSSIEDHTWDDKGGGFWRVALDWGGGHGYPFRWAMSPRPMDQWVKPGEWDYLQPGEEVEITGSVRIEQREDRMQFYVGLAHEGVGYPVNNVARTLVCVGIPNVAVRCPHD
jgi:hypothetical protein